MVTHVIVTLRVIHDFAQHQAFSPGFANTFASLELRNCRDG